MNIFLRPIEKNQITSLTQERRGEEKLGQTIQYLRDRQSLEYQLNSNPVRFCIIGIPEDIGVRANRGRPGASTAYWDFLSYFFNIQDNQSLDGTQILLLGELIVDDLMEKSKKIQGNSPESLRKLSELVSEIDQRLTSVVQLVCSKGKIPILIGGGHNNSYPALRGACLGLKHQISAVNIDPHSDLRECEGRHSGNGFSYALEEGYLFKYFNIGLHMNYNNRFCLKRFEDFPYRLNYLSLDEWIEHEWRAEDIANKTIQFIGRGPCGIEVDIDAIRFAECSAKTPVGLDENMVRRLIMLLSKQQNAVYLNIAEGVAAEGAMTGKLISYLVSDFIRSRPL